MSTLFEELDYRPTPLGPLTLRRRFEPVTGQTVFEIKLGEEHLMSSLFTQSEIDLARFGLGAREGADLEVVVGGLGLGYTAKAVLEDDRVSALVVVDLFEPVIDWHREGLLPMGTALADDERCRLVQGDFFALARSASGFDPDQTGRKFDAILLDIDHSPDALLDEANTGFYHAQGLGALCAHLKPGGIFGLWSNEPADARFIARLESVFTRAWAEPVEFYNPLQNSTFMQSVYLAQA